MGLLSMGTPLEWEKSRQYNEHVRDNGLHQLTAMFHAASKRHGDVYLWGDEVEYMMVKFDKDHHTATLCTDRDCILEALNHKDALLSLCQQKEVNFHPEYGRYMLEATPLNPYNGAKLEDYLYVESNMNSRRSVAAHGLHDDSIKALTLTVYPLMGIGEFTSPPAVANGEASRSLFLPDEIINRHVRFPTLTANIRKRRGEKVAINVPMYQDEHTSPLDDSIVKRCLFDEDEEPFLGAAKPKHIYMDSMGFGMGMSCLQVTVQAPDVNRARYLYDSWANFAPVFLALTAAAPVFKGFLADQDVRWNVISGSVDDRTPFERDVEPLRKGKLYGGISKDCVANAQKIPKSRYDSIDSYLGDLISDDVSNPNYNHFKPCLNDLNPPINTKVLKQLQETGLFDEPLARHFAHLYIRDPIVIFNERINQDDTGDSDHFENIQSTNWQTLRFKPPSQKATPDNKSTPGWRVEFRPMEIQITDFENAAYSVFIALLGQLILENDYNWYIPLSQVEQNMATAHQRDAVLDAHFNFKKDIKSESYETIQLTMDQIINGCDSFPGLIPLIKSHLANHFNITSKELSPNGTQERLYYYLTLISKRASGEIPTDAKFIRNFLLNHPDYKKDSKISKTMNYDLLVKLNHITQYQESIIELMGKEIGEYLIRNPQA